MLSSAGKRDGLYWPPEPGAPESPVGDFMARAAADGYNLDGTDAEPEPYLGYYFRVLTRQGPRAPGGALDYMVAGHMLAGHALLAFPAAYGETGIMSFMVGEAGVVYEADLGEDTLNGSRRHRGLRPRRRLGARGRGRAVGGRTAQEPISLISLDKARNVEIFTCLRAPCRPASARRNRSPACRPSAAARPGCRSARRAAPRKVSGW